MKTKIELKQETVTAYVRIMDIKDSIQEQKFEINNSDAKVIDRKLKEVLSLMADVQQVLNIK